MNGCSEIGGRMPPDLRLRVLLRNHRAASSFRVPLAYAGQEGVRVKDENQTYRIRVENRTILLKKEDVAGAEVGKVRTFSEQCTMDHFSLSLDGGHLKVTDLQSENGTLVEGRDLHLVEVISDNVDFLDALVEEVSVDQTYRLLFSEEGRILLVHPEEMANTILLQRIEGCFVVVGHVSDLPDHLVEIALMTVKQFNWERLN
jgi:hypothetical protein